MSDSLLDFLIALGTDSEALRRYQQDRNQAMDAAGLSPADKALLTQGDPKQLKAAISAARGEAEPPFHTPPPVTEPMAPAGTSPTSSPGTSEAEPVFHTSISSIKKS